jgi:fatty-acyl-CoA synthase
VMLPNTPEMVEVHYAVPALNAVLNALNTRLDADLIAWQMHHCEAMVLITDTEFSPTMGAALKTLREVHGRQVTVIDVSDSEYTGVGERVGSLNYEEWLAAHPPVAQLQGPTDEWDAIAVSYTSGTTGDPKGVVTHHRGAYLNAVCHLDHATLPALPLDPADVPLQWLVFSVDGGDARRHPCVLAQSGCPIDFASHARARCQPLLCSAHRA